MKLVDVWRTRLLGGENSRMVTSSAPARIIMKVRREKAECA
jgi:hypothetical protein